MARGIKLSKTAVFSIVYHTYENGVGKSVSKEPLENDYILGVGIDHLPSLYRDYTEDDDSLNLPVYFNSNDESDNTWYKTHIEGGEFLDPCVSITGEDSGDVELYAKWVQYVWENTYSYSREIEGTQLSPLDLKNGDLIFSWN